MPEVYLSQSWFPNIFFSLFTLPNFMVTSMSLHGGVGTVGYVKFYREEKETSS